MNFKWKRPIETFQTLKKINIFIIVGLITMPFMCHAANNIVRPSQGLSAFVKVEGSNETVAGFPFDKIDWGPALFSEDNNLEMSFFVEAPLARSKSPHIEFANIVSLNDQIDRGATILVGAQLFLSDIFRPNLPSKGISVLYPGGPELAPNYMAPRVQALLESGYDVILIYPRGTIDNTTLGVDISKPRPGVSIPIKFDDSSVDPVVVSKLTNLEEDAYDIDLIVAEVLRKKIYNQVGGRNRNVYIGGQSAGGQHALKFLELVGQGKTSFIPHGAFISAAGLPGVNRLINWLEGAIKQYDAYRAYFLPNKDFVSSHKKLFDKIQNSSVDDIEKDKVRRLLHSSVGFDIVANDESVKEMIKTLNDLSLLIDESGGQLKTLRKKLESTDKYYNNKSYQVGMSEMFDYTDPQLAVIIKKIMKGIGKEVMENELNIANFLSGYSYVHTAQHKLDYDRQVDELHNAGKFVKTDLNTKDLIKGLRMINAKGGRTVMLNGQIDPVSGSLGQFAGVYQEFLKYRVNLLNDPAESGVDVVLFEPNINHPDTFLFTKGDDKIFKPSPQLNFMLKAMSGELSQAEVLANTDVVDSKRMKEHIDAYDEMITAIESYNK